MSTACPPCLEDLPIPKDAADPRGRCYTLTFPMPSIPSSIADRNRRFNPYTLNATPYDLFTVAQNLCTVPGYRFIRKNDQRQMLMFCDGACSNNGCNGDEQQPRGGCGIVFTCKEWGGGVARPLANDGMTHTSNRAELVAIIMALKCRFWPGEGFESIVIATDSEYVVLGITERIQKWIERGWKTAAGSVVANQDLWKALLEEMRRFEKTGSHVQFWQIPREWNEADKYAKKAARAEDSERKGPNEFCWLDV